MNEKDLQSAEFVAYIIASFAALVYVIDTVYVYYTKEQNTEKIIVINNQPRSRKGIRRRSTISPEYNVPDNGEYFDVTVFDDDSS